jgi:hypothetical protein
MLFLVLLGSHDQVICFIIVISADSIGVYQICRHQQAPLRRSMLLQRPSQVTRLLSSLSLPAA